MIYIYIRWSPVPVKNWFLCDGYLAPVSWGTNEVSFLAILRKLPIQPHCYFEIEPKTNPPFHTTLLCSFYVPNLCVRLFGKNLYLTARFYRHPGQGPHTKRGGAHTWNEKLILYATKFSMAGWLLVSKMGHKSKNGQFFKIL